MKVNTISSFTDQNIQRAVPSSEDSAQQFSSYLNKDASLDAIFTKASQTYGVPKALLEAITKQESDFDPNATSHCGAQGLMQLMPATARSLGVSNAYDPEQNIMGGAKYISQLLAEYQGNVPFALAAYNAGSNNVKKYGGIPPFAETQDYVVKVMGYYNGGVSVPDVSYPSSFSFEPDTEKPDGALHNDTSELLDQLFSYEDYLRFIDLYTQQFEKKEEEEEAKRDEKEQEASLSDLYAFQQIRYSNSVINLLNHSR